MSGSSNTRIAVALPLSSLSRQTKPGEASAMALTRSSSFMKSALAGSDGGLRNLPIFTWARWYFMQLPFPCMQTLTLSFMLAPGQNARMREEFPHMTPEISEAAPFFIVSNLQSAFAFYRDRLGFQVVFEGPPDDPFFGIV